MGAIYQLHKQLQQQDLDDLLKNSKKAQLSQDDKARMISLMEQLQNMPH